MSHKIDYKHNAKILKKKEEVILTIRYGWIHIKESEKLKISAQCSKKERGRIATTAGRCWTTEASGGGCEPQ